MKTIQRYWDERSVNEVSQTNMVRLIRQFSYTGMMGRAQKILSDKGRFVTLAFA
jgi:hypothetical protein